MTKRFGLALGVALVVSLGFGAPRSAAVVARLPTQLTDQEFWKIATDASEPNGYFRSDNLTSNELWFQHVIPGLVRRTRPGGAYLGVGPEQNYTYIAAVRPAIAIIVDIRRGNLLLQLMYKAIFELADNRADFVSMLFSKPRPKDLGANSTAADLFEAFATSVASRAMYETNLLAIENHLTKTRHLPLSSEELEGIKSIFHTFFVSGFAVRPSPTYDELMTEDDGAGVNGSYLATEESFAVVKKLESKNLVIPVVGDFGGPKAIRNIAKYLKAHRATVSAFYLSNVEQYLYQDRTWTSFCQNVATLPLDSSSTFIRSTSGSRIARGPRFISSLGAMAGEVRNCGSF